MRFPGEVLFLAGQSPGVLIGIDGWFGGPTDQHPALYPRAGRAPRGCTAWSTDDHLLLPDEECERWTRVPRSGGEALFLHELDGPVAVAHNDLIGVVGRSPSTLERIGPDGTQRWSVEESGPRSIEVTASVEAGLVVTDNAIHRLEDGSLVRRIRGCQVDHALVASGHGNGMDVPRASL